MEPVFRPSCRLFHTLPIFITRSLRRAPVQVLVCRSADEEPRHPGDLDVSRWHEALLLEYP